jgi:CubicO group peptidase (beta-lactamase class C family)
MHGELMIRAHRLLGLLILTATAVSLAASTYFPARGQWESRSAKQLGFDPKALQAAVDFARAHESDQNRDTAADLKATFGKREPYYRIMGPTKSWEATCGIIIKGGYVAATWGPVDRVDMTHSISKTFLSTTVGLAWDYGLISNVHDRVGPYMPDPSLFAGDHNAPITWDHLLRQTSDWSGELWGFPDWADRPIGETVEEMKNREMHAPGTHFKYNDVRVNLLALAALHVWREPLPVVLRDHVMNPIGASSTWRWHGYEDSWITVDGRKTQSVSGGGHFGGGVFINAWDLARFGYLFLQDGHWSGEQIISSEWIAQARTPTPVKETYGYANWFLNTDHQMLPNAPATSVTFRGNGANIIYLDWENDLVIVMRWIQSGDTINAFVQHVLTAIKSADPIDE